MKHGTGGLAVARNRGIDKMNIENAKSEMKKSLEEVKEDIKILSKNIEECENILEKINSKEDVENIKFLNIEKGLKHIELF